MKKIFTFLAEMIVICITFSCFVPLLKSGAWNRYFVGLIKPTNIDEIQNEQIYQNNNFLPFFHNNAGRMNRIYSGISRPAYKPNPRSGWTNKS